MTTPDFVQYYWWSQYKYVSSRKLYDTMNKEISSDGWESLLYDLLKASGNYKCYKII